MSLHPASLVAVVALGWCGASALVAVAWSTTARRIKGRPLLNEATEDVDLLALARAVGVLREPVEASEVVCRTQADVEAAIATGKVVVLNDSSQPRLILHGDAKARLHGRATAELRGRATADLYSGSQADVYDQASVRLFLGSRADFYTDTATWVIDPASRAAGEQVASGRADLDFELWTHMPTTDRSKP